MRTRSYEFYEVVSDITGLNHHVHCRGNKRVCDRHLAGLLDTVDSNGNLYLIRCQLVEAYKADKK